jgi:hypothetical protein
MSAQLDDAGGAPASGAGAGRSEEVPDRRRLGTLIYMDDENSNERAPIEVSVTHRHEVEVWFKGARSVTLQLIEEWLSKNKGNNGERIPSWAVLTTDFANNVSRIRLSWVSGDEQVIELSG